MNHEERECLQCGGLVEGRANKRFCSAACRAQHFRDTQEETQHSNEENTLRPATTLVIAQSPSSERSSATPVDDQEAVGAWLAEYQRTAILRQEAERIRRLNEQCDSLYHDYSRAVTDCLKSEGTALDKWALERKISDLDRLSTSYRTHPRLQSGTRVHDRLEDVYWLHDKFRDLLNELKSQNRPVYPNTILLEFSSKRRAKLRANLLPD